MHAEAKAEGVGRQRTRAGTARCGQVWDGGGGKVWEGSCPHAWCAPGNPLSCATK